ncbi:YadA-like family protein, partial [Megamonas hypermegale]
TEWTGTTDDASRAATEGQLKDVQTQVGEAIGTGDFSRTNYARGAENVTEAIYGVDAQVKNNTDDLDAYKVAGIVAGTKVGKNDEDSIVIGERAKLWGSNENSIAIGGNIFSARDESISIGIDSNIHGTGSIAIGNSSWIGYDADNSIAFGYNARVNTPAQNVAQNAVAIGANSIANADNSIAFGYNAQVKEPAKNAVAIGANSIATESDVVSVGDKDKALQRRIVNVEDGIDAHDAATVGQMNTLIFGTTDDTKSLTNSLTNGTLLSNKGKSLVEGINNNTKDINNNTRDINNLGEWSREKENQMTSFAKMTSNVDWNAVNSVDWNAVSALSQAVPLSADVTGEFDTTREPINGGSSNTGDEINTGEGNTVNGDSHVTGNAQIDGTLNVKGEATFDGNATFNGKVDMNGELNMNNNKITGLAEGSIAEGSTDAVTGGQLFDMQSGLNSRMDNIESRMNDVEDRIDKVGAMAAAIANLRTMGYDPEAPTEIAVGVGQYKSETGLALGIFHYPNQDFMLSASISTSGDEVMGGIGATWKLGRKSAEERAKDEEERILAKAEEIKQAAKRAEVKAQADRHAQLLAEREAAGEPIRPVEEA